MSDFFTGYLDIVRPAYNQLNYEIELLQRQYMQAQIAVFPDQKLLPGCQ
jgi:hypothetical protein